MKNFLLYRITYVKYLTFLQFAGIRSQSKPHDIMSEVYKAMKVLNFVSIILCVITHFLINKRVQN